VPRHAALHVTLTSGGLDLLATCLATDPAQRLAQLSYDPNTTCPSFSGVVAVAQVDPGSTAAEHGVAVADQVGAGAGTYG
jgi:hypothetical protein